MPRTNNQTSTDNEDKTSIYNIHDRRNWIIPALLGLIALFLLALVAQGVHRESRFDRDSGGPGMHTMMGAASRSYMRGSYNANQNSIRGVVTAVNGSTFTVAGNGATNDVETNSSTQYRNGSSVKVNDSVIAFGSNSNGKFTATQVVINP